MCEELEHENMQSMLMNTRVSDVRQSKHVYPPYVCATAHHYDDDIPKPVYAYHTSIIMYKSVTEWNMKNMQQSTVMNLANYLITQ